MQEPLEHSKPTPVVANHSQSSQASGVNNVYKMLALLTLTARGPTLVVRICRRQILTCLMSIPPHCKSKNNNTGCITGRNISIQMYGKDLTKSFVMILN